MFFLMLDQNINTDAFLVGDHKLKKWMRSLKQRRFCFVIKNIEKVRAYVSGYSYMIQTIKINVKNETKKSVRSPRWVTPAISALIASASGALAQAVFQIQYSRFRQANVTDTLQMFCFCFPLIRLFEHFFNPKFNKFLRF